MAVSACITLDHSRLKIDKHYFSFEVKGYYKKQGGQNYAIVQHSSIPNLGVSVPLTMAKVVPHGTILTSGVRKSVKRNEVGGVTIALPAGMDWNQQNWSQMVVSSDQFTNVPPQTVWNIA